VDLPDTIKVSFGKNAIHVEIVLLLAFIAVARKVILRDPAGMTGIDYGLLVDGCWCDRCLPLGRLVPDQKNGSGDVGPVRLSREKKE
jgi:hypothetical protein